MKTGLRAASATLIAVVVGISVFARVARADEEKSLRPEIQQMVQSISEKLQAEADRLELTADQLAKIREIHASRAEQRKALRSERKDLLQEELRALSTVLTPEQREKVKELAEDRVEEVKTAGPQGLPKFIGPRETLAERVESAADKIGLTSEQRQKMIETLSNHAQRHAALKARCREACEEEFKAVAEVLTPEQRLKAREYVVERAVRAAAAKSVADRLEAVTDKMGLSADQRKQIAETHSRFAGKYQALRSDRRDLMREELKAVAAVLTPEQREKVKDFCEDKVVIIEVSASGRDWAEAAKALKETISERLEAVADKLNLSPDQRNEIRGIRDTFSDKFKSQRDQRKALRQQELQALQTILSADQREKVKEFVEDHSDEL
jgi:Spy/CpxP family protein refolding chaperone